MEINAYLAFDGQCEAAFHFYERTLGGEIESIFTYAGSPMGAQVSTDFQNKVMHGRLKIGNTVLMGSDAVPERYRAPSGIQLSISTRDPSEAERMFQALSDEGTVQMPLQQTFWALRFGMVVDRFGIPWMVNCEAPRP